MQFNINTKSIPQQLLNYTTFCLLFLLFNLINPIKADVSVSKPLKGNTYDASSGSASVEIFWTESQTTPKLTSIISYTFILCSGPNAKIHAVATLDKIDASSLSDYSYTASIDSTAGADGSYYIQIYAVITGGYTIHYTNRFTLTGMSGSYEPSGTDTAAPDAQTSMAGGTAVSIDSKSFTVPYLSQTGQTRYAPMQTQPGSTITMNKSSWTRKYDTSAVTYFTNIKKSLEQVSTITPGWSYTMSSAVNWASPAPDPTTWYAASAKLTRTPSSYTPTILLSTASKSS